MGIILPTAPLHNIAIEINEKEMLNHEDKGNDIQEARNGIDERVRNRQHTRDVVNLKKIYYYFFISLLAIFFPFLINEFLTLISFSSSTWFFSLLILQIRNYLLLTLLGILCL